MRTFVVLVGLAAMTNSIDCPRTPPASPTVYEVAKSQGRPTPPPPREFRVLGVRPLTGAVRILRQLRDTPSDTQLRRALAKEYSSAGFVGAASFFDNTARTLRGEPLVFEPVSNQIAWEASKRDLSSDVNKVSLGIARLASHGHYDDALRMAREETAEHGGSLQVVVQWADVVVSQAMFESKPVSLETLEPAIRVFVTSLLERVPRPIGVDSIATGFEMLSNLFLALNDKPSSLTAARLALHALRDSGQAYTGEEAGWKEIAAKRLEQRIRSLSPL